MLKKTLFISLLIFTTIVVSKCINSKNPNVNSLNSKELTILCLGDSYTIGESIDAKDRFPAQLKKLLIQKSKHRFAAPVIVAKTGWTTDEMMEGFESRSIQDTFDYVTLCIGVNDQYRGRSSASFKRNLEKCVLVAIQSTGGRPENVIALSIPDWSVTPYAKKGSFDLQKVSQEIDDYNQIKKEMCESYGIHFIEITEQYRKKGAQPSGYAPDGLHPSPLIYHHWAKKITQKILSLSEIKSQK